MKAWTIKQPGGRDQLTIQEFDDPKPDEGEVLVEVKSAGLNRLDILTRENTYIGETKPILGVEISGIVVENNSDQTELSPGTKVSGLVNKGGFSELATIPADRTIILPDNLSFEEGTAIPEVFLTAYQTMYWIGKLQKSETILIHAGGSGVGTAAIQMARQISDAKIIVTAGSKEKLDFCKELGANVTINYKEENFDDIVQKETNNKGANVILDFIGASYWEMNINSAAVDARWVLISTLGGSEVDNISLTPLLQKRIQLTGTLLTPRNDEYKAELTKEFQEKVMPYFKEKKINSVVHKSFSFEDLVDAQEVMEDNRNIGKLILNVNNN